MALPFRRNEASGGRSHPFVVFVLRRVVTGVVLVFVASILVFVVQGNVLPGDAATALSGRRTSAETVAALRDRFNLDKPLVERYLDWVGGLLRGDAGVSYASNQPVTDAIGRRLGNTLTLGFAAALVMFPLSIALGVLTGIRPNRPVDHAVSAISLIFVAVPEFVTGTLVALLLAVHFQLFPVISLVPVGGTPLDDLSILVLPVLTLTLAGFAYMVRMIRAGVMEAMATDYVQTARLRGIRERRVVLRHALRNALAPSIQVFALTLQWLVGGMIIVESVFAYPGIGQMLVNAVAGRDVPVVQALAILIAAMYIGINIVADLIVVFLIPKLRTAG